MSESALMLDAELTICGQQVFIRRSLELARRIESVSGALYPLAHRIEAGNITTTELSRVYQAIVRDDPGGPSASEIDAWLFKVGIFAHRLGLSVFVASLVIGSEALAKAQAAAGGQASGNGDGRSPFLKAA